MKGVLAIVGKGSSKNVFGGEGSDEEEKGETPAEESSEEDTAAGELADLLGVAEEKKADFKEAFQAAVAIACHRAMDDEE